MMVHELRAPLTAIKDSAELMVEQLEDEGKIERDQETKFLSIIDQQSKKMLLQIGKVLDAAKIEAGEFVAGKSPNNISGILRTPLKQSHSKSEKSNAFCRP